MTGLAPGSRLRLSGAALPEAAASAGRHYYLFFQDRAVDVGYATADCHNDPFSTGCFVAAGWCVVFDCHTHVFTRYALVFNFTVDIGYHYDTRWQPCRGVSRRRLLGAMQA